jgi:glycosyltransferase involved in cell wall biosynthesis
VRTLLANRNILIYAGNLGDAQGVDNLAKLMLNLRGDGGIGFLIIGRGTKKLWLQDFIRANNLENVLHLDEVDLATLNLYYKQCKAGLVFLDPKHQTHNIPGKFISYLEAGLPVVACVNQNNDLVALIEQNKLGIVSSDPFRLSGKIPQFIQKLPDGCKERARAFYDANYQPRAAAQKILAVVSSDQQTLDLFEKYA